MVQASISRRRPCRNCGGRYFAGTMSVFSALIAIAAVVGGIAKTVTSGGLFEHGTMSNPASFLGDVTWLIGGFVIAIIAVVIGHGHRCIQCDTKQ